MATEINGISGHKEIIEIPVGVNPAIDLKRIQEAGVGKLWYGQHATLWEKQDFALFCDHYSLLSVQISWFLLISS